MFEQKENKKDEDYPQLSLEVLQQKANFFLKSGDKVHVKYKKEFFKRGTITEVGSDFFMLNESLEGRMPVFFLEIHDILKFVVIDKPKRNNK